MSGYVIYWQVLNVTKNCQGGKVDGLLKQGGHDGAR